MSRIIGSESVNRKLAELDQAVRERMAERSLVAGALPVVNEAKRLAPYQTGTLRRSIHVGGHEDLTPDYDSTDGPRTGNVVPSPSTSEGVTRVYVGTDVEYAAPKEYGTSRTKAKPYMRPAADSQRAAVVQEVAAALRDQIQELFK